MCGIKRLMPCMCCIISEIEKCNVISQSGVDKMVLCLQLLCFDTEVSFISPLPLKWS